MKKFDSKKWIIENKFGKEPKHSNYAGSFGMISEQTGSITGSESGNTETWYNHPRCSPCPSGYIVSGSSQESPLPIVDSSNGVGCGPVVPGQPFEIDVSIIDSYDWSTGYPLYPSEVGMTYQEFYAQYDSNRLYDNPMSYNPTCAEEDGITVTGQIVFQGVCCDQNAQNYGQTNIGGYNIQQNEDSVLDNALMQNLLDQGYCDNSLCAGSAVPGDVPVDAMAPMPNKDKATPVKGKQSFIQRQKSNEKGKLRRVNMRESKFKKVIKEKLGYIKDEKNPFIQPKKINESFFKNGKTLPHQKKINK